MSFRKRCLQFLSCALAFFVLLSASSILLSGSQKAMSVAADGVDVIAEETNGHLLEIQQPTGVTLYYGDWSFGDYTDSELAEFLAEDLPSGVSGITVGEETDTYTCYHVAFEEMLTSSRLNLRYEVSSTVNSVTFTAGGTNVRISQNSNTNTLSLIITSLSTTALVVADVTRPHTLTYTVADDNASNVDVFGIEQNDSISNGANIVFSVVPHVGYEVESVTANEGDVPVAANGTSYTIYGRNVTSDIHIVITVRAVAYTVTLNRGTGYSFVNENNEVITGVPSVVYGGTYCFKLNAALGYTLENVRVYRDGNLIAADENGVYAMENITANTTVTVVDVAQETYTVTLEDQQGYRITPTSNTTGLAYGASFAFSVTVAEGYVNDYTVSVNGESVEGVNGRYSVAVTSDITVKVEGEGVIRYTVNDIGDGVGYTLETPFVEYGTDLTLSLQPQSGYYIDTVTVNSVEIQANVDGTYTVYNITRDQNVRVTVGKYTYTVNYTAYNGEDIEYSDIFTVTDFENIVLRTLDDRGNYSFAGWLLDGVAFTASDLNAQQIAASDYEITLTAAWTFNEDIFEQESKSLLALTLKRDNATTVAATLRMDTADWNEFISELNERGDFIEAVGFIFARNPENNADPSQLTFSSEFSYTMSSDNNAQIQGLAWDQENGLAYIWQSMTGISDTVAQRRYYTSWIILNIGGERVYVQGEYVNVGNAVDAGENI